MYRLLIVDDEPEIRQGLKLKIEADGLELAGEASNGLEALELLDNEPVDIVLTDMNMPLMDGVSFLEACRERHPDVRLVVITGYEDFQYARAALRHQASDYLLKPVARDELNAVLARLTAELDGAREETRREERARWELSQYYKEMKEQFVLRLVKGDGGRESAVRERAARFGLDSWAEREAQFLTVGFRPGMAGSEEASDRAPEQFGLPLELLCREMAESSGALCVAFRDAAYPGLIHFVAAEGGDWLRAFSAELDERVRELIGFRLAAGCGERVAGFGQWKEGYLSALLAWNLSDGGADGDGRHRSAGQPALSADDIKLIERCLERGELAAFEQAVRERLRDALAASRARFVKAIFQLYLLLETAAHESRVPLGGSEQLWLRPELALELDTVDRAGRFLNGIAARIDSRRGSGAGEADSPLMEAALRHIDENYMSDLNLTQIAERFNYNPSYFSELFKSKVGKTFIQYLTEARMAQAIRLLEGTQLGLWDIAELTGFSNASYFSSKFKRMFGMSPSDYRQKAAGGSKPQ